VSDTVLHALAIAAAAIGGLVVLVYLFGPRR
jgi:hypothetical protein